MYVYMTAYACGYVRMTNAAASVGAGRVFLARRERAGVGLRRRDGAAVEHDERRLDVAAAICDCCYV